MGHVVHVALKSKKAPAPVLKLRYFKSYLGKLAVRGYFYWTKIEIEVTSKAVDERHSKLKGDLTSKVFASLLLERTKRMLEALQRIEHIAEQAATSRKLSIEAEDLTSVRIWLANHENTVGLELSMVLDPFPGPDIRSTSIYKSNGQFQHWPLDSFEEALRHTQHLISASKQ